MYPLWEFLIRTATSESFSKAVNILIRSGRNPQEEAIDKIFDDHPLLRKKEYIDIRTAVKGALKHESKDKLSADEIKQKFEYLCHQTCPEETEMIDLACREVLEKFEIAFKTIVEDPHIKDPHRDSSPWDRDYIEKRRMFSKKR